MAQTGVSVGIVGAGINGVLMGIRLKQAGLENFTIYEKASDVGGTWQHNRASHGKSVCRALHPDRQV